MAIGRDVERGAHLGRGAGEVEQHLPVLHRHGDVDAHEAQADHVGLDVVGVAVGALGDMGDDPSRLGLGVIQHLIDRGVDGGEVVLGDQFVDALLGGRQAREASLHVAPVLVGRARVDQDHLAQRLVEFAGGIELLRRNPQALLEDLGRGRRDRSRHPPADVADVDETPGPAQQLAVDEDRLPQIDVRKMRRHAPRGIRIVGDEDVAFLDVIAAGRNGRLHRHADHHQHAVAARRGKDLAAARDQHGAVVLRLLDEHGMRGARHDLGHLVDDGLEPVEQDLQADLVVHHGSSPIRLAWSSTLTRKPGGM